MKIFIKMIHQKGLLNTLLYYSIFQVMLIGIVFFIAEPWLEKTILENLNLSAFSTLNELIPKCIKIIIVCLWIYIVFFQIREKQYHAVTGRSYSADHGKYHLYYGELVSYFKEADILNLNIEDLPKKPWNKSSGIVLGKKNGHLISFETISQNGKKVRDGVVAFIWGGPGTGKTAGPITCSCLQFGMNYVGNIPTQTGSVMCLDLKGEIYDKTKKSRNIKCWSTINPDISYTYDPLRRARSLSKDEVSEYIEELVLTLIDADEGTNSDSNYFLTGARAFLTGLIIYFFTMEPNIQFPDIIEKILMWDYKNAVITIKDSSVSEAQKYTNQFYGQNEKNCAGCWGAMIDKIRIYSSNRMKRLLRSSDHEIKFEDLDKGGTDIYIQISHNEVTLFRNVIAMLFNDFMGQGMLRDLTSTDLPPICYILDEFGQLPKLPVLASSAALMRGYNCSILICCQSLAMIDKHYTPEGRKELIDCSKLHSFLSIQDPDTALWASKLIGTKKVYKTSSSQQYAENQSASRSITEERINVIEPEQFSDLSHPEDPEHDRQMIKFFGKYCLADKNYYFK
jgi:hypothetical protein